MVVEGLPKNKTQMRPVVLHDARLFTLHAQAELRYQGNGVEPLRKPSKQIEVASHFKARKPGV